METFQTLQAVEKGLHVLCEKPLSTDLEEAQGVVDAAAKRPVRSSSLLIHYPCFRKAIALPDAIFGLCPDMTGGTCCAIFTCSEILVMVRYIAVWGVISIDYGWAVRAVPCLGTGGESSCRSRSYLQTESGSPFSAVALCGIT